MLGKKVKDRVTGFTGIVTGKAEYLHCNEIQYQVESCTDSNELQSLWLTESRLLIVER